MSTAEIATEDKKPIKKRIIPDGLWLKCPGCLATIYRRSAEANLNVCPKCRYHLYVSARDRLVQVLDEGTFEAWMKTLFQPILSPFSDKKGYAERLVGEQKKNRSIRRRHHRHRHDTRQTSGNRSDRLGLHHGEHGIVVGERLTRVVERATSQKLPLIIISASGGGARMHEGIFVLMQMAKVSAALARYHQQKGLYISVLTNPTMGG